MTMFSTTLKLDNGTVITVERSNSANEVVLAIDHGKEASVARLLPRERAALCMLLSSCGGLER